MPILGTVASSFRSGAVAVFESISTATITSAGSTFDLSGIPGTYKHLHIRGNLRTNDGGDDDTAILFNFNNNGGNNFAYHWWRTAGTTFSVGGAANVSSGRQIGQVIQAGSETNNFSAVQLNLFDYANTSKSKVIYAFSGTPNAGGPDKHYMNSAHFDETQAISSIQITTSGGFAVGSKLAVYGIKDG